MYTLIFKDKGDTLFKCNDNNVLKVFSKMFGFISSKYDQKGRKSR